jgi:transcriptional regulator with XRE-family HTH domain
MAARRLNNYLRTHRKHSGLSQSEVSFLIGLQGKSELSRYERGDRQPSLRTALACAAVFGTPVAELFAGLNDSIAEDAQGQMKKLHARVDTTSVSQSPCRRVMQKIQWVSHRLLEMPNFKLVSL